MSFDPDLLKLADPAEVIGVGSFGQVLAGTLETYGREQRVAVKRLPAMAQGEQRIQFEKELKAHITAQQVGAVHACDMCVCTYMCLSARAWVSAHLPLHAPMFK